MMLAGAFQSLLLVAGDHAREVAETSADSQMPFLILVPLILGALVAPGVGLWKPRLTWAVSALMTAAFSALTFVALFSFSKMVAAGEPSVSEYKLGGWEAPKGIVLRYDLLSGYMLAVLGLIALAVVIFSKRSVPHELPGRTVPFYGVFFVMLLGLVGMVSTGDLFNLYVFFEVSSIGGYALMAMGSRQAPVSAYRYLIMGTVGASFYLLGIGFLYALTGSLNMVDVAARLGAMEMNGAVLLSAALMVTGVGLKMAMFPMHLWLPDAYSFASSTATAIIAPVMTKVSAYVLIRLLFFVYPPSLMTNTWPIADVVTYLSLAGIIVGSVMAIAQTDIKRMLAYSSVGQVAYIGLALGIGSKWALIGGMLHILNHAIMKCALFLASGGIVRARGTTKIADYTSLARAMPWTFGAVTLAALGMIGLPPTNGFFSKMYLLMGTTAENKWLVLLAVVFSGLLTATYFFRLLTRAYTDPKEGEEVDLEALASQKELPWSMRLPLSGLALAVLLVGFLNVPLVTQVLEPSLPEYLGGKTAWPSAPLELVEHQGGHH